MPGLARICGYPLDLAASWDLHGLGVGPVLQFSLAGLWIIQEARICCAVVLGEAVPETSAPARLRDCFALMGPELELASWVTTRIRP